MGRIAAGFALAYAALAGAMAPAAGQTNSAPPLAKRPLTVDDVLGLQQLGDVVPSPDGKELAVVIKHAHTTRESYVRDNLDDDDHADIWLFPADGRTGRPLTSGAHDAKIARLVGRRDSPGGRNCKEILRTACSVWIGRHDLDIVEGAYQGEFRMVSRRSILPLVLLVIIGFAESLGAQQVLVTGPPDNAELAALFAADQADRRASPSIDWSAVAPRDSARRVSVRRILGTLGQPSSNDWYHAAMVMQHGNDTTAARLAHEWAGRAVSADSTHAKAKWLVAAAWDRYLMRQGKPQWYGTQFVRPNPSAAWELYNVDTTKVTDDDRRRLGVPSLAQQRVSVAEMNRPPL
jgi:hypothetical protein